MSKRYFRYRCLIVSAKLRGVTRPQSTLRSLGRPPLIRRTDSSEASVSGEDLAVLCGGLGLISNSTDLFYFFEVKD